MIRPNQLIISISMSSLCHGTCHGMHMLWQEYATAGHGICNGMPWHMPWGMAHAMECQSMALVHGVACAMDCFWQARKPSGF